MKYINEKYFENIFLNQASVPKCCKIIMCHFVSSQATTLKLCLLADFDDRLVSFPSQKLLSDYFMESCNSRTRILLVQCTDAVLFNKADWREVYNTSIKIKRKVILYHFVIRIFGYFHARTFYSYIHRQHWMASLSSKHCRIGVNKLSTCNQKGMDSD